jgi:hypothetical protein
MMRSLVMLLVGVAVGAGSVFLLFISPEAARLGLVTPAPVQQVACDSAREVARADTESTSVQAVNAPQQKMAEPVAHNEVASEPPDPEAQKRAITWRVSAIEKFVPLSDEQRQQLTEKFKEEQNAQEEGRESEAEPLEAIIGAESADVYRQQVKAAFERVQNEELDKEVVWMSRKLALSAQQEQAMRTAFASVESEIDSEFGGQHGGDNSSPQARVTRMIAENKKRVQLRAEALKKVLSPEQYTAYAETEAQSAASDMEVFHDPGE